MPGSSRTGREGGIDISEVKSIDSVLSMAYVSFVYGHSSGIWSMRVTINPLGCAKRLHSELKRSAYSAATVSLLHAK